MFAAGRQQPSALPTTLHARPVPLRAASPPPAVHSVVAAWPLSLRHCGALAGLLAARRGVSLRRRWVRGFGQPKARLTRHSVFDDGPYGAAYPDAQGGSELDELCEIAGWDLEEQAYFGLLRQPMSSASREEAWRRCNFYSAIQGLQRPSALWIVGPSAAGKSTVARSRARELGLDEHGWVLIDGEMFREEHPGFVAARRDGNAKGCVWWGAYSQLKGMFNEEKDRLMATSIQRRQNLVIPHTCLDLESCLGVIRNLKAHGYVCHVLGVYGDRQELMARGRRRAMEQGKRYEPREYELSMQAMEPMMAEANGSCQWFYNKTKPQPVMALAAGW